MIRQFQQVHDTLERLFPLPVSFPLPSGFIQPVFSVDDVLNEPDRRHFGFVHHLLQETLGVFVECGHGALYEQKEIGPLHHPVKNGVLLPIVAIAVQAGSIHDSHLLIDQVSAGNSDHRHQRSVGSDTRAPRHQSPITDRPWHTPNASLSSVSATWV